MRQQRQKRLRSVNVDIELRNIISNKRTEFRGTQKDIIQTIMHGQNYVLAIIPTGGGKSLLFILPVFCGIGGMTIVSNNRKPGLESILIYNRQVIILLIALRHDLRRRCQKAGIDYYE